MFRFRLALALGRTVQELQHSMTADELDEWQAFDLVQPIGERWTQRAIGNAAAALAAARGVQMDPRKLLPWLDEHPEPLGQDDGISDDQHAAALDRIMGF